MRFLPLLAAILLFPVVAHAQNKARLSQALESVRWNAAERGPLLAVAPGTVETTEPLPTGRPATTLSVIAPLFSRRIVPVGTVTVLAPETMVVLNMRPEEQTPPRMQRREALRPLLTSFDVTQWRKVGSDNGVGINDMETDEQREYFKALTDTPLPILARSISQNRVEPKTLLPKQLKTLRVRIQRTFYVQLLVTGADGQIYAGPSFRQFLPKPPEQDFLITDPSAATRIEQEESGRWVEHEERNRPKPGDLDFSAARLNPPVRLVGIKTVGDAVKRCSRTTGIELYVDGRMGRLPLFFRADANATVRSGDLLKGLCWMLTGTIRKVLSGSDSALILTDDIAGYGTRMVRINQQRLRESRERTARSSPDFTDIQRATQKHQAWQQLSDSKNVDFTPTGDIRKQLDMGPGGIRVPLSALPDDYVQAIERAAREHKGSTVNLDGINVRILAHMNYILPGIGPIRLYEDQLMNVFYFSPPTPPRALPEPGPVPVQLTERMRNGLVLVAAPKSAESARTLLQIASDKGIRQVWLESDVTTVRAEVGIGQGLGIMVGAMVSLLRTEEKDNIPRDLDIFGKESDWYLPDAPETFTKVQRRLRDYAAIPGLAGLILTDTAPPGCGIPGGDILRDDGSEIGYTPARRLAYLRSAGFDPIDLVRGNDEWEQPLPFMRDKLGWDETSATLDVEMFQANRGWGAVRYAANIALMQRLYADLRVAHPTLPLLVRNRGVLRHWYGSWDKPDVLPHYRTSHPTPIRPSTFPTVFQIAQSQSQRILFGITYQAGHYAVITPFMRQFTPLPDGPQALARAINVEQSVWKQEWDGLVLDLRTVPLATLPELLAGIE